MNIPKKLKIKYVFLLPFLMKFPQESEPIAIPKIAAASINVKLNSPCSFHPNLVLRTGPTKLVPAKANPF